jgi:hypothetical protein
VPIAGRVPDCFNKCAHPSQHEILRPLVEFLAKTALHSQPQINLSDRFTLYSLQKRSVVCERAIFMSALIGCHCRSADQSQPRMRKSHVRIKTNIRFIPRNSFRVFSSHDSHVSVFIHYKCPLQIAPTPKKHAD